MCVLMSLDVDTNRVHPSQTIDLFLAAFDTTAAAAKTLLAKGAMATAYSLDAHPQVAADSHSYQLVALI